MVSITTIAVLVLIVGFLAFGGLELTKKAVKDVKEKSEFIKTETQKRIDEINSEEV